MHKGSIMVDWPTNPLTGKPEDLQAQMLTEYEKALTKLIPAHAITPAIREFSRIFFSFGYMAAYNEGSNTLDAALTLLNEKHQQKLATSEQQTAALAAVYERASELTRGDSMAVAPLEYRRAFTALTIACLDARAALAAAPRDGGWNAADS